MALIRCPECGREVSDKAPSCPNCGVPITEGKKEIKIPVYFSRPKAIIHGIAITGTVMVDGYAVGSAENGSNFSVMLKPGNHNIVIESNVRGVLASKSSNSASLYIPDDAKRVDITLKIKPADAANVLFGVSSGIIVDEIKVERFVKEYADKANPQKTDSIQLKMNKNGNSKVEALEWTCINCQVINQGKAMFCCECGEPRHYAWKCSNCGEMNEAKVKFCFNCGKKKEITEEVMPSTNLKSENMISLESLLPEIEKLTKGSEILEFIEGKDNLDLSDEKKESLFRELQRIINLERIYGFIKNDYIRIIKKYISE